MDKNLKTRENVFIVEAGSALPLGVTMVETGVQFAISLPNVEACNLLLYKKGKKEVDTIIPLTQEYKLGSVFFVVLAGYMGKRDRGLVAKVLSESYEYLYEVDGKTFLDPYCQQVNGRGVWGAPLYGEEQKRIRGGIVVDSFNWEGDRPLKIPLSDMILYQMHVRGFTKHTSSKVAHKGTFAGVIEKADYLQDLGITGVLLMPCYDFNEIMSGDLYEGNRSYIPEKQQIKPETKVNYWGYGQREAAYFAPKASYAADKEHVTREFKEMVKQLHRRSIEVIMDFSFYPGSNLYMVEDCLRHWVLAYHVDGFRVNLDAEISAVVVSDPILNNVKILSEYWSKEILHQRGMIGNQRFLAEMNHGFMNDVRSYLKGDEGKVQAFVQRLKRNPSEYGVINYVACANGFTLMDAVSYDCKHNEANGEHNMDGTEYNYSWNCGVEGKSRKRKIIQRRRNQIRNAFIMLLLSQGTPMILAGDEFGNSQNGNNNAYCQDNSITWLNWNQLNTNQDIYKFVKQLIRLRGEHPVFHMPQEFRMMDTKSCGYPDFSVHGTKAWFADFTPYNRMLGVMYAGAYAVKADASEDNYFYVAYNMHWEAHAFDLPKLPDDKEWCLYLDSADGIFNEIVSAAPKELPGESVETQRVTMVSPRSVVIFVSVDVPGKPKRKKRQSRKKKEISTVEKEDRKEQGL